MLSNCLNTIRLMYLGLLYTASVDVHSVYTWSTVHMFRSKHLISIRLREKTTF